jgi:hypothetical protein
LSSRWKASSPRRTRGVRHQPMPNPRGPRTTCPTHSLPRSGSSRSPTRRGLALQWPGAADRRSQALFSLWARRTVAMDKPPSPCPTPGRVPLHTGAGCPRRTPERRPHLIGSEMPAHRTRRWRLQHRRSDQPANNYWAVSQSIPPMPASE